MLISSNHPNNSGISTRRDPVWTYTSYRRPPSSREPSVPTNYPKIEIPPQPILSNLRTLAYPKSAVQRVKQDIQSIKITRTRTRTLEYIQHLPVCPTNTRTPGIPEIRSNPNKSRKQLLYPEVEEPSLITHTQLAPAPLKHRPS